MALPFAAIALPVLIGVAVFGGFDPRKKKDKPPQVNGETPAPGQGEVACATTMTINPESTLVSLGGGPWISEAAWDDELTAMAMQRPVVMTVFCSPDTVTLSAFNQFCRQVPQAQFLAVYVDQLEGAARAQLESACDTLGAVAMTRVIRMQDGQPWEYSWQNEELILQPGEDLAEYFALLLDMVQGGGGLEGYPFGE